MTTSNFTFLQAEWPALFTEATKAEQAALTDPRTACFYARRTLELAVVWLFQAEGGRSGRLQMPYKPDLSAFLFEPSFKVLVGPALHAKMDVIRKQGNNAVHSARPITAADATAVLRELFQVAFWLARHYGRNVAARPDPALQFRADLLPRPVDAAAAQAAAQASAQATQAALQKLSTLADELAARDAALATAQQKTAALDAELAQLRAEVAAAKAANTATPDTHDYNETETRDLYIDLLLKEAGWKLDQPRDREFEVQGMPNNQGVGYVDYVLWGDDGKPLAVVEAKRTQRDARVGQQQAKLYADCLQTQFGQRPLIYTTNGFEHWFWDDTTYPPRPVQGFHKKDELQLLVQRRTSARPLAGVTINPEIVERHYQHRAIRRIGETFERDRQRKALVVMATGAGKTRTVIALVDMLQRANWAKRILFLADRVALVNQAANAFKAHLPDASAVNLVTDKETEGRVFVSTYPTMMGLINESQAPRGAPDGAGLRRFGVGHFDLIIVDEAHRSIYQKYRAIFSYFDALLVGLTATPKDEIDRNTYGLFGLEDGVPTDAYGLEDAIAEGYLVPPRAVSVPLKFQREGIRYAELSEDERAQWDELDWSDDVGESQSPDEVGAEAVNKWLFNIDTVDKVLELLMTRGHKVAGGDRLGKTIVFAKNNAHANFIADRFNANYPHYAGQFARVITYQTEYAQSLIDDFSVKDKAPHIAISVDMLDTGIDVPEVVNLVFFKVVRSKAKFWQMVGRGTRLCKNLFGPEQNKQEFLILDFCQNLEFFGQNLEGSQGAVVEPLSQRLFKARLELLGALDARLQGNGNAAHESTADYGLSEASIRADTAQLLHHTVAGMSMDNFVVRPQRRWVEPWSQADKWHAVSADELVELAQHVSGLPSSVRDDDEDAKRFDLLMLRTQLGSLHEDMGYARLCEQVRSLADALLELSNIPEVKKHIVLIEAVAGEEWWQDVTLPMLEQARRSMRGLIKLLEKNRRKVVYTDLQDQVGELTEVALPLGGSAGDFERFRLKVRAFLRAHESHITLHKLRRNQPLTATDLAELERLLIESGTATAEDVARAVQESHGLGLFVRSQVGLDREAATQALNSFVAGKTLNGNQLEFVNLIVTHLTERGVMDPALLYEPPFTSYAPQGPDALFTVVQVNELFGVLDHIAASAQAA
jgi:type I restriction enzyme, R subunit